MSQAFYPQYSSNNQEYIESLVSKEIKKYADQGKVQNAVYNPKSGWIHVTSDNVPEAFDSSAWGNWPRIANYNEFNKLKALSASGQKNVDQAQYDYISSE